MITLFRILFWSAAIFAFIMAALPQPPLLPGAPPDKVLHILAFACLALLGSAAYPRLSALKLVGALSVFGAIIEVVQLIPELHRDAELLDWIADTAAVIAVVFVIHVWRRIRGARQDAEGSRVPFARSEGMDAVQDARRDEPRCAKINRKA